MLRQVVRREDEPVRVRAEWVEAWKAAQRKASWTRGQLPELERGWEQMKVPETLPAFDALHLDESGYLWVRQVAGEPGEWLTYDVFSPDGHLLGPVPIPIGLRALPQPVITNDAFIGVWTDELDVETVRVYAMRRPT